MKKLYYVRHGESELNKSKTWAGTIDTPLTTRGHEQAKARAKALKEQGLAVDIIVSSPLVRAHDTAKHIARQLGHDEKQIVLNDMLVERHFGALEGKPQMGSDHEKRYMEGNEAAIDGVKNVETAAQMQARARKILAHVHSLPQDNVLVVAHGALARAIRRELEGDTSYKRGKDYDNAEFIEFI